MWESKVDWSIVEGARRAPTFPRRAVGSALYLMPAAP